MKRSSVIERKYLGDSAYQGHKTLYPDLFTRHVYFFDVLSVLINKKTRSENTGPLASVHARPYK